MNDGMDKELNPDGDVSNSDYLLRLCRDIRDAISHRISKFSEIELGEKIGIGKDGTPTKKVDIIAEEIAIDKLRDFRVITEESGVVGEGNVIVALDPIDGTFNAVRKIPFYSVSICFSKSDKLRDVFFAYVSNLETKTEYYASGSWKKGIAFKNGNRIFISGCDDIKCNAIFYYPHRNYNFKRIRIFGSASLELCLVADGSFDCFVDIRKGERGNGMLRVYDVSAGLFISKCAGAKLTDIYGNILDDKKISMDERFTLVVANEKLHSKLIKLLEEFIK